VSSRPIQQKKLRKLERAIRKGGGPNAHIDLIDWLKTRGYAQTTGAAVRMLIDGKVRVDSHVVGRNEVPDPFKKDKKVWGIAPLIPAHHRDRIVVDV
jgi:hypothetical protein